MACEAVCLDMEDGVATITLSEPKRLNALSDGIKDGIEEAITTIEKHDNLRCVLFEGEGRAFCAGGDIQGMEDQDETTSYQHAQNIIRSCERIPMRIYNLGLPTIAKVDGYCVGAGVGVALACDVILASNQSQIGLVFRNIGLTLDYATSLFVTRAIGPYAAKELALKGDLIPASEACDLGLVNHVYPDEEFEAEVDEFVEHVATGPTIALNYAMRNIDKAYNSTIREVIEREALSQTIVGQTNDRQEGIDAFREDRDPLFEGY